MGTPLVARTRFAALITAVGISGALASSAHAAPATVTVQNKAFGPSAVTVNVGESVTWDFKEDSHNVKGQGWSGNNSFGTGTYAKTFDAAGTYSYVCEAHPDMKGTVTVNAAAQGPAPAPGAPGAAGPGGANPTAGAAAASNAAWTFPSSLDRSAPLMRGLSAHMRRGARRATLQVRLSEDALVVVGMRRVMSARIASAGATSIRVRGKRGANNLNLRVGKLRAGKYRLRIVAVDAAGNESATRTATLRVR